MKGLPVWPSLLRETAMTALGSGVSIWGAGQRQRQSAEGSFWQRDANFSVEMEAEFVIPFDSLCSGRRQGSRVHAGRHARRL